MIKAAPTLAQLVAQLHAQAEEMTSLRRALDVQFRRIADMQAELDVLPQARKRRQALLPLLAVPPSRNVNGRSHG